MAGTPRSATGRSAARNVGPPLAVPALMFVAVFATSLILQPVLGSGASPSPFAGQDVVGEYFAGNHTALRATGFLQFLAALVLAVFTAVTATRMRYLAPHVPGPAMTAIGGCLASVFLAVSGLLQWVLGQAGVDSHPAVVQALHHLFFAAGGPAHTSALGLLMAGISVTALFLGALPRWLCATGIVIATVSVLSLLTFLVPGVAPLIAMGRFTGMIWIVAVAFSLPRSRPARSGPAPPNAEGTGF